MQDPDDVGLSFDNPEAKAYESHSGGVMQVLANLKEKAIQAQNDARKSVRVTPHPPLVKGSLGHLCVLCVCV